MPSFEILRETETAGGWTFDVQILSDEGELQKVELTLSWADYNHWSVGGSDEPMSVANGVIAFLVNRSPDALKPRLDASLARRLHEDADEVIPTLIAR